MFLLRWYRVYPVKEAIRILLNLVVTIGSIFIQSLVRNRQNPKKWFSDVLSVSQISQRLGFEYPQHC